MDYVLKENNQVSLDEFLSHMVVENGITYNQAKIIYYEYLQERDYFEGEAPDEVQKVLNKYFKTNGVDGISILR